MNKYYRTIYTLIVVLFGLTACAISSNYGKLVRSGEIDDMVESAQVLADHTYYFTGPEDEPDAIIAIQSGLTLKSKYWIKVENVAEQLETWNRYIENETKYLYPYEGARILNLEGEQVGIWYSRYDHTVIEFPDPSSIIIYAPYVPIEKKEIRHKRFGETGI